MPQTVIVDGQEIEIHEKTTIGELKELVDAPDDYCAICQESDATHLLHDDDRVVDAVPSDTEITFPLQRVYQPPATDR